MTCLTRMFEILPFWNSLETTKSIHRWTQGAAIFFFALLVLFEAVAHWSKKKEITDRFLTFAIVAFALAVVLKL
jgi:divalent metal cation (Fe/Co/Zn/Cd) transporter